MFEIYKPTGDLMSPWLVKSLTISALLIAATMILNPHQRHPHPTLLSASLGVAGILAVLVAYWPYRKNQTFGNQRTLTMTANGVILLLILIRSHVPA
jgi:hypothetical protein